MLLAYKIARLPRFKGKRPSQYLYSDLVRTGAAMRRRDITEPGWRFLGAGAEGQRMEHEGIDLGPINGLKTLRRPRSMSPTHATGSDSHFACTQFARGGEGSPLCKRPAELGITHILG